MKIDIDVPDGISGDWRVESFEVSSDDFIQRLSAMKTGRYVPGGTYKRLMCGDTCVMSNTPDEIRDFSDFVCTAKGDILVNGLGLGVLLKALLNKPDVLSVTVIEKSKDVIDLVSPSYKDDRVTIINADAYEYQPPKGKRYYAVWHDIWNHICADNLDGMKKLHRKYGRRADYQESWCRYKCEQQKKANDRYFRRW